MTNNETSMPIDGDDSDERVIATDQDTGDLHVDIDDPPPAMIEEAPVSRWRIAAALTRLRDQVNVAAPRRSKKSDGTVGDAAHASRASDHNPWVRDAGVGVVTAMDITHDPAGGCDAHRLADALRRAGDPRIKYIISNRRIASAAPKGSVPAWAWRAYTGSNPHNHHAHFSVRADKAGYDATGDWPIAAAFGPVLESVEAQDSDDPEVEVALGLAALGVLTTADPNADADAALPLLARLLAVRDGADALLTSYAAAARGGQDMLEGPAPRFEDLRHEYEDLFARCVIPADKASVVAWHRKMLLQGKARYVEAERRTGVPWWFIGIVHAMEASFNFRAHLHNGDPLTARTVQVPARRPPIWNPPGDWLSSAIDALQYQGFAGEPDWALARTLYRWEAYNGFGYRRPSTNIPTPYLWSFSNHHTRGKYVRDGKYDPNALSKQCGAAVMLKALQKAGDIAI